MKNNFSLKKDHYLRVLFEFTIIGLLIISLYNGLSIYLYIKNKSIISAFLYLNLIPIISFIIFLFRYSIICIHQCNAISGIGEIVKLYEKGKGWYRFDCSNFNNLICFHNSLDYSNSGINLNKINRFSNIQGIEYVYYVDNITMLTRRQYVRNVSIEYLHKNIYDTNKINISINSKNQKKAYII